MRILDAAAGLFGDQMYDHVTLSAVAAGAGVTVQTVIRRFGSKEELFSAVARRRSVALRGARDEAPAGDTSKAIELLLAGYERWGAEILHLLAQERRSPVIAALLDEARRFHRDWVARVFAPLLSPIDPARQQHELAKLVAVTDLYTWKILRQDTRLNAEDTRAAISEMVEALTRRS